MPQNSVSPANGIERDDVQGLQQSFARLFSPPMATLACSYPAIASDG